MKIILKTFERLGYLRAASEMQRMGYPDLADTLYKQAKELESER